MGEEKQQTISLRIPEETYEALKKYAEEHGESVSDVLRGLIDELLSGAPAPGPSPSPSPSPGLGLADEVKELKRLVGELGERETKTVRYIGDMCWRFNEVQGAVNHIMGVLAPYVAMPPAFPQFPPPGWRKFEEGGKES
jgi:hypothetical protein